MSYLQIKISAKEEKNAVVIYECTGKYDGDNKGGYGILNNITLANVTSAQFEIYKPNQTTPLIINVFPNFPSDDKEMGYELGIAILQATSIESGVWKFGYRIGGVDSKGRPFEKYTETKEVFIKSAECCVDKVRASTINIPASGKFKDERKKSAAELTALLSDAKWAKGCGKFAAAQDILTFINLQCECCN
jgi:hypothetical protein